MSDVETLFRIVEEAAMAGSRCPTRDGLEKLLAERGAHPTSAARGLSDLARAGRIRVLVYRKNWRVVEIREGEHKGKRTMRPPGGGKPYVTIEKNSGPVLTETMRTRRALKVPAAERELAIAPAVPPKRKEPPREQPTTREPSESGRGCQWIFGNVPRYPAKPVFCGKPCVSGRPYCETHDDIATGRRKRDTLEEGVAA